MQESFIRKLEDTIKESAQEYHATGSSKLSDEDFDELLDKLSAVDANNPLLTVVGNGFEVDKLAETNDITEKDKFQHPIPVGSITKVKSITALIKWLKPGATFSTKIDGNSIVCYYKDGVLQNVATRGKDNVGINRTTKFKRIVPLEIPRKGYVAVRGEAAIKKSKYTTENGFDLSKSSRNAVAGAITRKDDWEVVFNQVDFIAYTFLDIDSNKNIYGELDWNKYFKVESQKTVNLKDLNDVNEFKKLYKDNYEYDADGVVFRNPDGEMLAFKFEDESAWTVLEDVVWSIGVDQRLTPVASLKPVQLAGATISNASIGSYSIAVDIGAWPVRENHLVKIIRANEIIPHILATNMQDVPATKDELIVKCPVCGSHGEVRGEHIFCVNKDCPNIDRSKLYSFSSNFYPEMLSDKIIEKVFDRFKIKSIVDLLKLDYFSINFSNIEGIGKKHANTINSFFDKIHKNIDSTIIYKSILNECGRSYAEKIVANVKFNDYIDMSQNIQLVISPLKTLRGFNSNIIGEMIEYREYIQNIAKYCKIADKIIEQVIGTFAITGTRFSKMQLDKLLLAGWKEDSSLKKTTKVLVVADINSNSEKMQKARKYGVKIMDIEGFLEFALTQDEVDSE